MKNLIFLGIDQTGAIDSNGNPKPLPACLINKKEIQFFYLKTLSKTAIQQQLQMNDLKNLLICVDSVLGLPEELNINWPSALEKIKRFPGYGRKPAKDYFRHLGQGQIFKRQIEIFCKANSVFAEKPFQKNIQTGTFRIWKELTLNLKDFYIPALENKKFATQLPLYEGYPSYSWKLLLKSNHRRPTELTELIVKNNLELNWSDEHQRKVNKDANLADAFVLALTILKLHKAAKKLKPHPEGWILGVKT